MIKAAVKPPPIIHLKKSALRDGKMQKTNSLKENRDFRRIYNKGKSYVNPALVIYIMKNRLSVNRIGITAGKKIGNAVFRNRARRIIREAYRLNEQRYEKGFDIIFVARTRTTALKTRDIQRAMNGMMKNAGVLKK